jgi:hypothetical protein
MTDGWHWLSERDAAHSLATCTSANRLSLRERSQCFRVPFGRVLPLQRALAPLAGIRLVGITSHGARSASATRLVQMRLTASPEERAEKAGLNIEHPVLG